jgi:hypothetical protein
MKVFKLVAYDGHTFVAEEKELGEKCPERVLRVKLSDRLKKLYSVGDTFIDTHGDIEIIEDLTDLLK